MTRAPDLAAELAAAWSGTDVARPADDLLRLTAGDRRAVEIVHWLAVQRGLQLAGMAVREEGERWHLHYLLYEREPGRTWVEVACDAPVSQTRLPSLSPLVHAADWHEREAEDHFGIEFEGHPRLGDFVLHDEEWPEGLSPMRKRFNPSPGAPRGEPNRPGAPGASSMSPGRS